MPLTECPDCGGVVSDAALTCPTCHRVLTLADSEGAQVAKKYLRWALVVLLVLVVPWVLLFLADILRAS